MSIIVNRSPIFQHTLTENREDYIPDVTARLLLPNTGYLHEQHVQHAFASLSIADRRAPGDKLPQKWKWHSEAEQQADVCVSQ